MLAVALVTGAWLEHRLGWVEAAGIAWREATGLSQIDKTWTRDRLETTLIDRLGAALDAPDVAATVRVDGCVVTRRMELDARACVRADNIRAIEARVDLSALRPTPSQIRMGASLGASLGGSSGPSSGAASSEPGMAMIRWPLRADPATRATEPVLTSTMSTASSLAAVGPEAHDARLVYCDGREEPRRLWSTFVELPVRADDVTPVIDLVYALAKTHCAAPVAR